MVGVSDIVCPWGRPVWGGLAFYFNRGVGVWCYRTPSGVCFRVRVRGCAFSGSILGLVFLAIAFPPLQPRLLDTEIQISIFLYFAPGYTGGGIYPKVNHHP